MRRCRWRRWLPTKDPGPSTASKPATPPAPAEVTLVVESEPSGARVVGADDQVLGATPLTLTRPAKGPGLSLRVEKDGYVTVSRTVSLVRDETLAITLERKPRPASSPSARPSTSPRVFESFGLEDRRGWRAGARRRGH